MATGQRVFFLRNDNSFTISGFKNALTNAYLNEASIATWELRTAKTGGGSQVGSGTMSYVDDSNGDYVGTQDAAVSMTEGETYWLHIILSQDGIRGDWEVPVIAQLRNGRSPTG